MVSHNGYHRSQYQNLNNHYNNYNGNYNFNHNHHQHVRKPDIGNEFKKKYNQCYSNLKNIASGLTTWDEPFKPSDICNNTNFHGKGSVVAGAGVRAGLLYHVEKGKYRFSSESIFNQVQLS